MKKLIFCLIISYAVYVHAQEQDTSSFKDIRYKIQNEDFFLKYHGSVAHYLQRAALKMQIKEPKEAILDYTKAIELDGNNAAAFNGRGKAFACTKNYEKAIEDFEMAVKLNPEDQTFKDNLKLLQIRQSIKH